MLFDATQQHPSTDESQTPATDFGPAGLVMMGPVATISAGTADLSSRDSDWTRTYQNRLALKPVVRARGLKLHLTSPLKSGSAMVVDVAPQSAMFIDQSVESALASIVSELSRVIDGVHDQSIDWTTVREEDVRLLVHLTETSQVLLVPNLSNTVVRPPATWRYPTRKQPPDAIERIKATVAWVNDATHSVGLTGNRVLENVETSGLEKNQVIDLRCQFVQNKTIAIYTPLNPQLRVTSQLSLPE